eukprot:g14607.t1
MSNRKSAPIKSIGSPKFEYKGYPKIYKMSEKRKLSDSNESSKKTKLPIDQLTLTKEKSIFIDKTFREKVDKDRFINLMHSKQLLTKMPPGASGKWVEMKKTLGLENEFKQFFKLYKNMTQENTIRVYYNASKHGWGRVSPVKGLSLGLVRCEPRHTVAKDLYNDIDMKNCFPSVLHQLCLRHKIDCPKLSKYVAQREEWLKRLQNTHNNTEKVDEHGNLQPCEESISREEAKKLVLEILHGKSYSNWKKGSIKKKDGKWVNPVTGEENTRFNPKTGDLDQETMAYEKEIKGIIKVIKEANPSMYKEVTKDKAYNKDGTFMSIYLQEWERRLLECAYTFFKEKEIIDESNNCVLCFDGIMVSKDAVEDIQALLIDLQQYIKNNSGVFKVTTWTEHELKSLLAGVTYEKKTGKDTETRGFSSRWLTDIDIKTANRLVNQPYNGILDPSKQKTNVGGEVVFNVFQGYNPLIQTDWKKTPEFCKAKGQKQPTLKDMVSPFLRLMRVLAEGDNPDEAMRERCFIFLRNLIACKIQFPQRKLGICIIMESLQGVGKNVFWDAGGRILGSEQYLCTSQADDVLGKHAEAVGKLLIAMNECQVGGNKAYEGLLKSRITETQLRVNPKHTRPFDVEDYAMIVALTNKSNPLPVDISSMDRRFISWECGTEYRKKSSNWWQGFVDYLHTPEFISAAYEYFNSVNIAGYDFKAERKKVLTKSYQRLAAVNVPCEALVLAEVCKLFATSTYPGDGIYFEIRGLLQKTFDKPEEQTTFTWSLNENGTVTDIHLDGMFEVQLDSGVLIQAKKSQLKGDVAVGKRIELVHLTLENVKQFFEECGINRSCEFLEYYLHSQRDKSFETCAEAKTKLVYQWIQKIMHNEVEIKKSQMYKFYCLKMEEWKCAFERSARRFYPKVQELRLPVSEKQKKGNEHYCFRLHDVYSEMIERSMICPDFALPGYDEAETSEEDTAPFNVNDF